MMNYFLIILLLDIVVIVNSFLFTKKGYRIIKSSTLLRISTSTSAPIISDFGTSTAPVLY